jgi:rSAM/selenodomain-associated transferase 1
MNTEKNALLFFVRYPRAGAVKTRLAVDCSPQQAANYYSAFVEDAYCAVSRVPLDLIVCYTSDVDIVDYRRWFENMEAKCRSGVCAGRLQFQPQKGIHLGQRMQDAFEQAFAAGYDNVLLCGSDIPALTGEDVHDGLRALKKSDCCLGPAADGGYYLIGFRRDGWNPAVFEGIPWSTDIVLAATVKCLAASGQSPQLLRTLPDIDVHEDLDYQVQTGVLDRNSRTVEAYFFYKSSRS